MTLGAMRLQSRGRHSIYENRVQTLLVTLFPILCPELIAGPEPHASSGGLI